MSKEGAGFLPGHASLAYFFLGASTIVIGAACITPPVAGIGSGAWCMGTGASVGEDTSGAEVIDTRGLSWAVGEVGLVGSGTGPDPGRLE